MHQLFAAILALAILPVLLKWKIPSGYAIILMGIIAGLVGGFSAAEILRAFSDVFFSWSSLSSVLAVIQIALLGALMTRYGLFRRAEEAIKQVLPVPKLIIMLMPSLIGVLQVPGGAALSAPFCNSIGQKMRLSESQRSNTNVICRHQFSLFLPFSAWVIQINELVPELDQQIFLFSCLCFSAINVVSNYFFFLRKAEKLELPKLHWCKRLQALGELLVAISPILTVFAVNSIFGLPVAFCVPFAILVAFLLSDHDGFGKQIIQSFNKNLAWTIIGVYFFQNIIKRMDQLLTLGSSVLLIGSELVFLLGIAIIAILFGVATGLIYVSLGVLLPIIVTAFPADPIGLTIAAFYVFCWSYIGYMFSPVHMCQLLSDRECGSTVKARYRTYIPMFITLAGASVMLYGVTSLLFH